MTEPLDQAGAWEMVRKAVAAIVGAHKLRAQARAAVEDEEMLPGEAERFEVLADQLLDAHLPVLRQLGFAFDEFGHFAGKAH